VVLVIWLVIWLVRRNGKVQAPPFLPPQHTQRLCPQCGTGLAADAPQGLCPKCLMKVAMGSQFGEQGQPSKQPKPALPSEEIARFFPQLEILELLGQGGMGTVYKARQSQLDRFVALKILSPELSRDPAFAERFSREAKALAHLNHPNIVAVYDFGKAGDFYYFIMEFVDGLNLSQMEQATKRLAPKEALAIVPKICDALQYAHDEGIVHRDIKPANILIDKKGRVKIADFGLAKLLGKEQKEFGLTESKMTMGTPHYMAPEQVEHPLDVDHRADIYSLGVVFYEMLTGELPLGRFSPPSQKVQMDVRIDEIVLRALEKEPERRYQQASQLKTQVETIATPAQQTHSAQPEVEQSHPKSAATTPLRYSRMAGVIAWLQRNWVRRTLWVVFALGLLNFVWPHTVILGNATETTFTIGATQPWTGSIPQVMLDDTIRRVTFFNPSSSAFRSGILALVIVIVLLLTRLKVAPRPAELNRAQSEVKMPTETIATSAGGASRFSRKAIIGAAWAPFFFFAFFAMFAVRAVHSDAGPYGGPSRFQTMLMITLLPLGLTAPFGTTILGWIAIGQIRRSAGKLWGLGLALFDALLFPLLALDVLINFLGAGAYQIWAAFARGTPQAKYHDGVLLIDGGVVILVSIVVDVLIVRPAWRAVTKPVNGPPVFQSSQRPESTATPRSRGPVWTPTWIIVGVVVAAILLLGALGVGAIALAIYQPYAQRQAAAQIVVPGPSSSDLITLGETLDIAVEPEHSFNGRYLVRPGGFILLKGAGQIFVAGKTSDEAAEQLRTTLNSTQKNTAFIVTIKRAKN
jgi:serine/threonine protein kinase